MKSYTVYLECIEDNANIYNWLSKNCKNESWSMETVWDNQIVFLDYDAYTHFLLTWNLESK